MAFHLIVGTIALVSLAASIAAYRLARRALHRPSVPAAGSRRLRVHVLNGQARRALADDTRQYALLASLTNDTDGAITVARLTLRVSYQTRANFLGAVDLESLTDRPSGAAGRAMLPSPATLDAGSETSGWVFFTTANVIPRHCRVTDYALLAHLADGDRVVTDASLPALLRGDTDGEGSRTWGWD
jgi:hypothetical protein